MNHAAEETFAIFAPEIWRSPGQVFTYMTRTAMFVLWMVTSLFLAVPISQRFGPKVLVISGLMLYNVDYIILVIASLLPAGSVAMHVAGIFGAACLGVGTTFMYAGEGIFFARTAELVAVLEGRNLTEVTSHIASIFAFWFLMIEFVAKMVFWGIQQIGVPFHAALGVMLAIPLGATAAAHFVVLPVPYYITTCKVLSKEVCQTFLLWKDVRIWLISILVVSFAVAANLLNGNIANQYVTPELGAVWKALFSAALTLVASLSCLPFKFLAVRFGKASVLAIGAVAIILMPLLFFLVANESLHLGGWLIIFFLLQGIIRAIYAAISKAVYADHFSGPDSDAAMSNWSLQAGIGFTVTTFMQTAQVNPVVFAYMLLVLGCLLMPCYWAAHLLQKRMPKTQSAYAIAQSSELTESLLYFPEVSHNTEYSLFFPEQSFHSQSFFHGPSFHSTKVKGGTKVELEL
jgi:hypothetical protein